MRSTTRYLNKVRFRTLDHFPVIVKIEGKDLRTKKRVKGWAGWIPRSEVQNSKFQERVLCPNDDSTEIRKIGVKDWSPYREDWKKQRPRSKLPGQPCGTETSSQCRTRSGRWR